MKVSYTGNIDTKSFESQIKLYTFSNFEFSSEVKAKNEGGLYYYTSQLTNSSTGAGEITDACKDRDFWGQVSSET